MTGAGMYQSGSSGSPAGASSGRIGTASSPSAGSGSAASANAASSSSLSTSVTLARYRRSRSRAPVLDTCGQRTFPTQVAGGAADAVGGGAAAGAS